MNIKTLITALLITAPTFALANPTIADLKPETRVIVSGVVDRITDEDTFILRDETGEIKVYIGPNLVPFDTGSSVTVHGIVDDDLVPEIYANRLETTDGQVIDLDLSYE